MWFFTNMIPTRVWGPLLWDLLHSLAHGLETLPSYTQKQDLIGKNFKNLMDCLKLTMPCSFCRNSLSEITLYEEFATDQLLLNQRPTLWLFNVHNLVNVKLRKPTAVFAHCKMIYETRTQRFRTFDALDFVEIMIADSFRLRPNKTTMCLEALAVLCKQLPSARLFGQCLSELLPVMKNQAGSKISAKLHTIRQKCRKEKQITQNLNMKERFSKINSPVDYLNLCRPIIAKKNMPLLNND